MTVRAIFAENAGPLTGHGNNTWLLDGARPALVDAGVGRAAHVDAIQSALRGRALDRVVVTHGHADHASGVPALQRQWPNLTAWKFVTGDEPGWRPLADGQVIQAGSTDLTVIHTPGHAADHVCFWNPSTADLFAGDMIARGTTIMIPAGQGGGMRAYLSSLRRLADLKPRRVFPGHGPVIENPGEVIDEFIAHRLMREQQVRACLESGIVDPAIIVSRIYPDLPRALVAAAGATVEAHIEKLRDDGI